MKKRITTVFLSLILLAFTSLAFAQNGLSASNDGRNNIDVFWDSIRTANEEYVEYQNNKSNLKNKSLDEFLPIKKASARFFTGLENNDVKLSAQLSQSLFANDKAIGSVIFFDDQYEPNAGVDANGNVVVGVTLLGMLSKDEFTAIMAHEAAHLALKHHEIGYFNYMKNTRNAKITSAIVSGLYAATVIYSESYKASKTGAYSQYNIDQIVPTSMAISDAFMNSIEFQNKLYTRDQEIEADFAAAAYLDYIGIGRGAFVSALDKIRAYYADLGYNTKKMNKNTSHPSLDDRIEYISTDKRPPLYLPLFH